MGRISKLNIRIHLMISNFKAQLMAQVIVGEQNIDKGKGANLHRNACGENGVATGD